MLESTLEVKATGCEDARTSFSRFPDPAMDTDHDGRPLSLNTDCDWRSSPGSVTGTDDLTSIGSWNDSLISCSCLIDEVNLSDFDWKYRGEGGANLVISLPHQRTIVRFTKSKYPDKDHDSKVQAIAHYANHVMRPALGEHYVRPITIGTVHINDLELVKDKIQEMRPRSRCNKDIAGKKVILSTDCVQLTDHYEVNTEGPTFSIEIKPKQGFLSIKDVDGQKVGLCHRCLKQYTKLQSGQIEDWSDYCPLDLFSGHLDRMKQAIFDLFEDPHNRFKIFKNGEWFYTETFGSKNEAQRELQDWFGAKEDDTVNRLASLICTSLLSNVGSKSKFEVSKELLDCQPTKRLKKFACNDEKTKLPSGCILDRLLQLQQQSEMDEVEAKSLRDKLLSHVNTTIEDLHQVLLWQTNTLYGPAAGTPPSPNDDASIASSISDYKPRVLQPCLSFSSADFCDVRRLQQFLLSVTAKDVSLLITFKKIKDYSTEESNQLPSIKFPDDGQMFRAMISVIDLDPKPVTRIKTWLKRKEDMLEAYSGLKHCQ